MLGILKLGTHQHSISFHLSQQLVCIPLIPVETFRQVIHGCSKVCFETPCLRRFKVPDLLPPTLLFPTRGDFHVYFQHDLASSRGPNLDSGFAFPIPSLRGVKRPSGLSNLISNHSDFHQCNPFAPIFIGFSH
ncbi:hypothetical protein AVEN_248963-1 [Araneus ventricosus]|uniref:Uncharacterized protein n=1 Tax=Araneus ventricosus TaxID=182803 RepID=A0A4Y2J462_ARAVE|nr:hypothetical protein AVEN_248963-1 [Araneus ventricosus]